MKFLKLVVLLLLIKFWRKKKKENAKTQIKFRKGVRNKMILL
jgi:hypothetical protein